MRQAVNAPAVMFLLAAGVLLASLTLTTASEASEAGKLRVYATILVLLIASSVAWSGRFSFIAQAVTSLAMGMTTGSSMLMFFASPVGIIAMIFGAIGFVKYIATISQRINPSWPTIIVITVVGFLIVGPWL